MKIIKGGKWTVENDTVYSKHLLDDGTWKYEKGYLSLEGTFEIKGQNELTAEDYVGLSLRMKNGGSIEVVGLIVEKDIECKKEKIKKSIYGWKSTGQFYPGETKFAKGEKCFIFLIEGD